MEPKLEQKFDWLKQHLVIDIMDISQELMQQPVLFQEAVELAARLKSDERVAAHEVEIVRAKVAAEFRDEKRDKPYSEAAIQSMLVSDIRVQEARNAQERLRYEAEIVTGVANALQDKTRLLAKTADLMNSGFITPSSAYDRGRQEMRDARKASASPRVQLKRRSDNIQEEEPDA